MRTTVPDLVRTARLEVELAEDGKLTKQVTHIPGTPRRPGHKEAEEWRRVDSLGRGAMGQVYREICTKGSDPGAMRAVKEVKVRKDGRIDYNRELEAAFVFSAPKYEEFFVRSFGWYEKPNFICLTMELLSLGDLTKHMEGLSERSAGIIVKQVLSALEYMHIHDFVHRDLKPNNILVREKGPNWKIKIADFGISKRAAESTNNQDTGCFTNGYASPEQCDRKHCNHTTDIWSTGIIAFQLLTGELPFSCEDYWVFSASLKRYCAGKELLPQEPFAGRNISSDGRNFVSTLLRADPSNRPSAETCLLHGWFSSSALQGCSEASVTPTTTTAEWTKPVPKTATATSKTWSYWNPWTWVASPEEKADPPKEDTPELLVQLAQDGDPEAIGQGIEKISISSMPLPEAGRRALTIPPPESHHSVFPMDGSRPRNRHQSADEGRKAMRGCRTNQEVSVDRDSGYHSPISDPLYSWRAPYVQNNLQARSSIDTVSRHSSNSGERSPGSHQLDGCKSWHSSGKIESDDGHVTAITMSDDGNFGASTSYNGTLKVWIPNTDEYYTTCLGKYATALRFSSGAKTLAVRTEKFIMLFRGWPLKSYATIHIAGTYSEIQPFVSEFYFSVDGERIAAICTETLLEAPSIYLINVEQGRPFKMLKSLKRSSMAFAQILKPSYNAVTSFARSPDLNWFAAGLANSTIQLWNLRNRQYEEGRLLEHHRSEEHRISRVAFSKDGFLAAVSTHDDYGLLKVWNPEFALIAQKEFPGRSLLDCAFHPTSNIVAVGDSKGAVSFFDPGSPGRPLGQIQYKDFGPVLRIVFSPDGRFGVSCGYSQLLLWKTDTREIMFRYPQSVSWRGFRAVFSADSNTLAFSTSDGVQFLRYRHARNAIHASWGTSADHRRTSSQYS